jgi:Holliday junction resolvase RusA-like endonuclease
MLLGYVRPVVKPDADNLLKTIADALNGVCYSDDSQIVEVTLNKWYAEEPKAEILIREISK